MNPGARRGGAGAGRGQPFVPLFSGRRVLVVVFNQQRGIEPDPERRGKAPQEFRKHDKGMMSMLRFGELSVGSRVAYATRPRSCEIFPLRRAGTFGERPNTPSERFPAYAHVVSEPTLPARVSAVGGKNCFFTPPSRFYLSLIEALRLMKVGLV
jgi:hypothetical protein